MDTPTLGTELDTTSMKEISPAPATEALERLERAAIGATRGAALACQSWVGRGDKNGGDGAAVDAMRTLISTVSMRGVVVIGEGEKDEAPMLFDGEELGTGDGPDFDIAVDPLECTTLCAKGMPGSLTTIAMAEAGSMTALTPAYYMDKLVGPAAISEAIDITAGPEENLRRVAEALDKPVDKVRVVVLDKPRHEELIERLHKAGARVVSPPDGDVAGALATLLPDGGADLIMGIGGTPEGVMTACAIRALGGCMQGRIAPQKEDEAKAVEESELDTERVYELEDLVSGEAFFVATGVTSVATGFSGGTMLRRPWRSDGRVFTESIVITAGAVQRVIQGTTEPQETDGEGQEE